MGDVTGRRIAAALIDAASSAILLVVIAKGFGDEGRQRSLWAETEGGPRTLFLLLTFAYFFGTELVWAQTLGKRVMKLRVVRRRTAPSRRRRGRSSATSCASSTALPVLYIIGGITVFATGPRAPRLGDIAAKTKVVADDAPPPPPAAPPRPARGRRQPRAGPALTRPRRRGVRPPQRRDVAVQTSSVRQSRQRPPTADGPAP